MHVNGHPIPKIPTRIRGLDEVLDGGLPLGRTTLVSGGPGSGKTVLGLEFLCRGATEGVPGVFVTFEERAEAVRKNALSMGFDLAALPQLRKSERSVAERVLAQPNEVLHLSIAEMARRVGASRLRPHRGASELCTHRCTE